MLGVGSESLMTSGVLIPEFSETALPRIVKELAICMQTESVKTICFKPSSPPPIKFLGGPCAGIHPTFKTYSRNLKSSLHLRLHDVKVCEKDKVEKYRSIDDEWET